MKFQKKFKKILTHSMMMMTVFVSSADPGCFGLDLV